MKAKKSFEIKEELVNKIISVAYGDAGLLDKLIVKKLIRNNPDAKTLYDDFKNTADQVHKINEVNCPNELIAMVEKQTSKSSGKSFAFTSDILSIIFFRPIASAFVTIIFIGFVVYGVLTNQELNNRYSQEEIELADKQAKHALAIVGKIFNQTNTTLKEDVLNLRVAKPIRESVGIINNLFNSKN